MALSLTSYVAGEPVVSDRTLDVFYPYDGSLSGTVVCASGNDLERAEEELFLAHPDDLVDEVVALLLGIQAGVHPLAPLPAALLVLRR